MRPLRWGVVGTGKIAHVLTDAMVRAPQWAVPVAVASRSRERAKAFAAKYPGVTPVLGCAALVTRADIDAVYIASPPSEHLAHALLALDAGKAVLCEKPLTTCAKDTERLAQVAREHGVFLMEALWTRFVPSVVALRELVRDGRIGTPTIFDAELGMVLDAPADHYLWSRERGGGALLDVGPYAVSLATMLLGRPDAVHGLMIECPSGVDVAAGALLGFPGGAFANFRLSFQAEMPPRARLIGSHGSIALEPPLFAPPALVVTNGSGRVERLQPTSDLPGWAYQLREVAACAEAAIAESPVMPLAESILCARVLDAIRTDEATLLRS